MSDPTPNSLPDQSEVRLQYGALPYRCLSRLEVLVICTRETRRWVIPKGWPVDGTLPHVSAAIEAREEAGVEGRIAEEMAGFFHYRKRLKNGVAVTCRVEVFPLEVLKQRKKWPEMHQRETRWHTPEEAAALVSERELADIVLRFAAAYGIRSGS